MDKTVLIPGLEGVFKERSYQQRLGRPFKVVQNLPLTKNDVDYSVLKHALSIKDSAVLYNSLHVSRYNWLHAVFRVHWSKREQAIVGEKDTVKKDKIVRFCDAVMDSGVHAFQIKMFFLKDDAREKAFAEEQERKRLERVRRREEKELEKERKRLEREKLEKEKEAMKLEYEKRIKEEQEKKLNAATASTTAGTTAAVPETTITAPNTVPITTSTTTVNTTSAIGGVTETQSPAVISTIDPATPKTLEPVVSTTPSTIQPKQDITFHNQTLDTEKLEQDTSKTIVQSTNIPDKPIEQPQRIPIAPIKTTPVAKSGALQNENAIKLISNPENALLIQNLNLMARTDAHLNEVMKEVASGNAPADKIIEFKNYIIVARNMGDPTGYMEKFRQAKEMREQNGGVYVETEAETQENMRIVEKLTEKAREKAKLKAKRLEKAAMVKPEPLTPEERKKREEESERQSMIIREQLEMAKIEKQRLKEEKEAEKIRIKLERAEKKAEEKEARDAEKQRLREEKIREKERKREEKLAEKERMKMAREKKKESVVKVDDSDSEEENDRMAKLISEEYSEDLWNDKLSPLQERYSKNSSLVFEFLENTQLRFIIPRDTIYEVIENSEEDNNATTEEDPSKADVSGRPKSPYVTIIASFILVHNQAEIDGWDRRKQEAIDAKENKIKKEKEEVENKKRKRKKSGWATNQATKRATRATRQAKEMESLRREEENYHEEDEELGDKENSRPLPVYSCMTVTLSKIPFRFADFVVNSGNDVETCTENMKKIMEIGTRVQPQKLWYQLDGFKDELLAETLRYNLNRLDYANSTGKRTKHQFLKKFGRGGG